MTLCNIKGIHAVRKLCKGKRRRFRHRLRIENNINPISAVDDIAYNIPWGYLSHDMSKDKHKGYDEDNENGRRSEEFPPKVVESVVLYRPVGRGVKSIHIPSPALFLNLYYDTAEARI
jgi:hypothetical protein